MKLSGRSILLSTHYMDEADLLGDRINIISKGKLQCSGTSLFLKRQFGKGYFLSVTRDQQTSSGGENTFDIDAITKFIVSYIPGSKLHENFDTELTFLLPSSARLTGEFTNLFQNLEKSMSNFGIKNYGISDTTLEEVLNFFKFTVTNVNFLVYKTFVSISIFLSIIINKLEKKTTSIYAVWYYNIILTIFGLYI